MPDIHSLTNTDDSDDGDDDDLPAVLPPSKARLRSKRNAAKTNEVKLDSHAAVAGALPKLANSAQEVPVTKNKEAEVQGKSTHFNFV